MTELPTLVAVAHGTANPDGLAEIRRLINIVRTKRPGLPIELCWLERAEPSLADLLAGLEGPAVVVPLLLSTGYHVKVDIAAVVGDRPQTAIAAQLGPDERISKVVLDRLLAGREASDNDVVLFSAGSSDPEAFEQLTEVAGQLQAWLRAAGPSPRLTVHPRFLEFGEDWLGGLPEDCSAANYLLAPGHFNDLLRKHGGYPELCATYIAEPIGAHPLVAAVIADRYDEAAARLAGGLS